MGAQVLTRALVVSDLHCGHKAGLTPPDWQYSPDAKAPGVKHIGEIQRGVWGFWEKLIAEKYDVAICNGDAIDGKGEASGGTEQLTADREEQVEMAFTALSMLKAKRYVIIYGTPYHTGKDEDWELVLAKRLGAHIGSHEFLDIDGVVFDLKHKVGSSSIPHGRSTAINKERLWATMWAERDMAPHADVLIRSHVHYYGVSGDANGINMTTPGLQWDTKYGKRQCSGTIDLGAVEFICDAGKYTYNPMLIDMRFAKAEAMKI